MEKIIQITAGKGPAECTWVAAQVLKKILAEAAEHSIETTVLHREAGAENGTVATAVVKLKGKSVDAFAASWLGTIQWIGQSSFRKYHKRKNWFIGVFEIDDVHSISLNAKDIHYQTMRSSGAGGQHVNKVSSAIRATHLPSGLSVVAMDSRSQHQNKKLATERLMEKYHLLELDLFKKRVSDQWENQLNVSRGNPVKIFTGSDFKSETVDKRYKATRQKLKQQLIQSSD